jgi:hypothetical protein
MPLRVMTAQPSAYSRIPAAVVLAAAVGFGGQAAAQPGSLREGLFGRPPADGRAMAPPPVARYVSETGDIFILDRSQPKPLLKFEHSPEVWVLLPQPGPRGDVIYKNDLGEPVLRATRLGGVTVFTDARPSGAAAALAGGGSPLKLAPLGPQALLERLAQASARASRAARRLIPFDADATPASSALIADAAIVASEAVVRLTRTSDGRLVLAQLRRVQLIEGRKSSAELSRGTLKITVAPAQGVSGRPSSERIVTVALAER